MATLSFRKATKSQSKLRMALDGPSGSGKTFTGLTFATALAQGGKMAVIDTERGSASKYADMFTFDVLELDNYHPQNYIDGIDAAEQAGYAVILIDSLSHAWEGEGGVLELHEQATKRDRAGNSYTAWRDVTPVHRALVDAILQSKCHIIVTMRSKTEYVLVTDDRGKTSPKKVGMAPVQRAGMEYEFDIVADMDTDHNMIVSKSRCFAVADNVVPKPDAKWMGKVVAWLTDGAPAPERPQPQAQPAPAPARIEAPKPASSNGITRPYSPEKVLQGIGMRVRNGSQEPATKEIKGATVGALDALFLSTGQNKDAATQKRHMILSYLVDKTSSADLTDGEARALLAWAQERMDDGSWVPSGMAVKEAEAIVREVQGNAGQTELEFLADDAAAPVDNDTEGA